MAARIRPRAGFLPLAFSAVLFCYTFPLSAQTLTATKVREDTITRVGLTVEHYSKLLNGQAYQQNAIMTYNGYQYSVYWNSSRHVCIYRRNVSTNVAQTLELTDYANTLDDSNNNIMMGICSVDGTDPHHDVVVRIIERVGIVGEFQGLGNVGGDVPPVNADVP